MDNQGSTPDVMREQDQDNDKIEPQAMDGAHALVAYDRIMQAIVEHGEDLDRISQAFSVIAAETFGDLCSIQVLNQNNEMIHLAGMYDVDPRALALLADAVAAMADM